MSSGAAGGGTWEANRRARSSKPRAPSRISPMQAAERAASATFPCRFVLLPFSVLSVDLFLCARLGWFGGTEKPNRRNRHRTRRFLILWQTDRLLICGNRSLQQPNKPNRFVGLNRMPTLRSNQRVTGQGITQTNRPGGVARSWARESRGRIAQARGVAPSNSRATARAITFAAFKAFYHEVVSLVVMGFGIHLFYTRLLKIFSL